MMIKLHMTFLNSDGKKHTWIPRVAKTTLTDVQIQETMVGMTELGIFKKGEVGLYNSAHSAKYVETTETPMFDAEA